MIKRGQRQAASPREKRSRHMPWWSKIVMIVAVIFMTQALYGDLVGASFALSTYAPAMAIFVVLSAIMTVVCIIGFKMLAQAKRERSVSHLVAGVIVVVVAGIGVREYIIRDPAVGFAWKLVVPYALVIGVGVASHFLMRTRVVEEPLRLRPVSEMATPKASPAPAEPPRPTIVHPTAPSPVASMSRPGMSPSSVPSVPPVIRPQSQAFAPTVPPPVEGVDLLEDLMERSPR